LEGGGTAGTSGLGAGGGGSGGADRGAACGTIAFEADDGSLVPAPFVAVTVNV
jgi:hypothetical protein